jgi:integrase/recombinase XerD
MTSISSPAALGRIVGAVPLTVDVPPLSQGRIVDTPWDIVHPEDSVESNRLLGSPQNVGELDVAGDTIVVLGAWRSWLEAQYSENTVRHYWQSVMRFYMRHPVAIEHVTEDHIVDFLQQFPFRSSARRSYYQGLKSFFEWAERRELIDKAPTKGIRVPVVEEKVPRSLTHQEYLCILNAAYRRNPRRGATVKLLYSTAARVGEIVTLRWVDISVERLTLHGHKTGQERIIDMTPGLHQTLGELWTFFGSYENVVPRSGATIWQWCTTAGKDAGIEKVHPHLFRSTAATTMQERGANPYAVQRVLGHASIKTTMKYVAVSDDERKDALGLL